jgi:hypothetical protein
VNPLPPGAWRLVLKRAAHDRLVVGAAFVTIVLATTLLASGPIYAEAVALSGLHRTLEDAPVREATLEVSGQLPAADHDAADERVTRAIEAVFGPDGVAIHRSGWSDSFDLPAIEGVPANALTVFAYYDDLRRHAEIVSGTWPSGSLDGPVEAALPHPAAEALGLAPGDALEVASSQDESERVEVQVSGVYRVDDVEDPFWWGRALETDGREQVSFTTFGPLVVSEPVFFALGADGAEARWRAAPNIDKIGVEGLDRLRLDVDGLEDRLNSSGRIDGNLIVRSGLENVLARAERSLLVSRSGVLVPSVQLAILAGAALLFLAGLLAERRGVEAAIFRSRGASPGEVGQLALAEGALLAVPAVVAGPWLASLSLRTLNEVGPLADIGLELEPRISVLSYVLAVVAGVLCAAGLALPALRSAAVATAVQEQGRPRPAGIVQRAGLDLVLVALAALAYWQLRLYEGPVVESIRGRIGIDPLLVVAPALGLLAGALLSLRIVPVIGSLVERIAAAARGLVAPLGTWQLARRPARYARAAVLLTLALAIGLFASAYGNTWLRSQEDRAAYEAGADVRVVPDGRTGSIPTLHLAGAYARVDGVEDALPVLEQPLDLSGVAEPANLLAVDVSRAAEMIHLRSDLGAKSLAELTAPLAAKRPQLAAVELPGDVRRVTVSARLSTRRLAAVDPPDVSLSAIVGASLGLVFQDADGLLHPILAGQLIPDGQTHRLDIDLGGRLPDGSAGVPSYPLDLVAVELHISAAFGASRQGTLAVESISADSTTVQPSAAGRWTAAAGELPEADFAPEVLGLHTNEDLFLGLDFAAGSRSGICRPFCTGTPVTFTATPGRNAIPRTIPALVTDRFLDSTGTQVGGAVALGPDRPSLALTGSVRGFPTLPPHTGGVIVDLSTYLAAVYLGTGTVIPPRQWLLEAAPGRERAVARMLDAPPYSSAEIVDRAGMEDRLTRDPVALGISGALSLGFVVAAVFAIVGFAVSAAVSAAERTTEFAVLRALGLTGRQLTGWLALEGGVTAALALAGGIALGASVAWLVLPFVSLAGEGGKPFPEVVVDLSWEAVAVLTGAILAALSVILAVQLMLLRRLALGPALRAGENR